MNLVYLIKLTKKNVVSNFSLDFSWFIGIETIVKNSKKIPNQLLLMCSLFLPDVLSEDETRTRGTKIT